jgi:predicted small metal-binding protein
VKQFSCGDVVPGCGQTFRGTQEQILDAVAHHARDDHGLSSIPDSLVAQVLDHIALVA